VNRTIQHRSALIAAMLLLAGCNGAVKGTLTPADEATLKTAKGGSGTLPSGTASGTKPGTGTGGTGTGGTGAGGTGAGGTGAGGTGTGGTGAGGTGAGGTGGTGTTGTTGGTGNATAGTSGAGGTGAAVPGINPANGLPVDASGGLGRGVVEPQPGDKPLPAVSIAPSAQGAVTSVRTADGKAANYIFAGNTIFVEAQGLKPDTEYRATLNWPNGKTTFQDFKADAGGNMVGPQGKFIEYPHAGFFKIQMKPGEKNVIEGQYSVDVAEKASTAKVLNIPFAVKGRPIIFCRDKDLNERTLYFSDQSEQVFLHGEGYPPDTKVLVWLVKAPVNRLTPMEDGMNLADKVFEGKKELAFQTDAKGIIDAPLLAWFTRDRVEDPLVLVSKFLNSDTKYIAEEDVVISDHPTFLIKTTAEFFGAVGTGPGATPPPAPPAP